jgi:hypothetical protein
MAQGTGEHSASLDYGEANNLIGRGIKGGKPQPSTSLKEVKQNCEKIFKLLTCHPSGYLFIQPLDPANPRYQQVSKDFINLNMIELNFRNSKYENTFKLEQDFRKMINIAFSLYQDQPENS